LEVSLSPSSWNTIGIIGVVMAFATVIGWALLDAVFGVSLNRWSSGLVATIMCSVAMTVVGFIMRDRSDDGLHRELRQIGTPAAARVLEVHEKDVVNHVTQRLELLLEVMPEGRPSFRAKTYSYVPFQNARAFFSPGGMVRVLFDPRNPSRVVVE
jgi:hypothetical protein